ncbi:MAG: 3-hydroxyacyl-CoA dehydrogenase family protein [Candidatus Micrarchaeaceae archaeon]|jgi:3-hydroxybutyryl-CoA dehydrogenase
MTTKTEENTTHLRNERVGLIGVGFMGRGIAACLLSRGLEVHAYDKNSNKAVESRKHIESTLYELGRREIVPKIMLKNYQSRLHILISPIELDSTTFLIESIDENLSNKREVYKIMEDIVPSTTIIASNTSSLPITTLQAEMKHPERFIGMHWGEPAEIMRYLEVVPGEKTSNETIERTLALGDICGKEPTLLKQDIQGFISNRLMYAMIREAIHLVESGIADVETVDRSFRNDIGYWATIAGPFRWMDLTGIPAYATVMEGLLPKLSNSTEVPELMRKMVESGAEGITTAKGFYDYSKESASEAERKWIEFTYEIRKLAEKYNIK